jgi:hypothetical protein
VASGFLTEEGPPSRGGEWFLGRRSTLGDVDDFDAFVARGPSLNLVRGQKAGDMMVDGVAATDDSGRSI